MILYGTKAVMQDLGPVHPQDCEKCGSEQPFRIELKYVFDHIWFVFGNVRGKTYFLVCDMCQTPYRIGKSDALKLTRLKTEPIPFLRRFGCLMLFVVFTAACAISVYLGTK